MVHSVRSYLTVAFVEQHPTLVELWIPNHNVTIALSSG